MLRVVETMTLRLVVLLAVLLMLANTNALAADGIEEKAKLCAACHGEKGIPINNTTPVIWGQNEGYLYLQLRDFKSGSRKNALMSPMVASLEKADMLALAAHFTKLKWPNLEQADASNAVAAKAQTAAGSIGCRGCHLEHFQGDGTTARLAGQWQEYLHNTMMAFRDGSRGNNPGMSDLMKATAPGDLEALSKYLAGLQIDQYLGNGR
ncbi:MAG: cytochrome c4 [Methyloceanibacter sp.]